MSVLVVWAVIAGQPTTATHEFGQRAFCEAAATIIFHQLESEGAQHIRWVCADEPAT